MSSKDFLIATAAYVFTRGGSKETAQHTKNIANFSTTIPQLTDWGLTALSAQTATRVFDKYVAVLKKLKLMRKLKMLRFANRLHKIKPLQ